MLLWAFSRRLTFGGCASGLPHSQLLVGFGNGGKGWKAVRSGYFFPWLFLSLCGHGVLAPPQGSHLVLAPPCFVSKFCCPSLGREQFSAIASSEVIHQLLFSLQLSCTCAESLN